MPAVALLPIAYFSIFVSACLLLWLMNEWLKLGKGVISIE